MIQLKTYKLLVRIRHEQEDNGRFTKKELCEGTDASINSINVLVTRGFLKPSGKTVPAETKKGGVRDRKVYEITPEAKQAMEEFEKSHLYVTKEKAV